jgi:hypothetical protein
MYLPLEIKNNNVLKFSSFYILGIGLMMATKQQPKHLADLLSSKVVF